MVKVETNTQTAKTDSKTVYCWTCSGVVNSTSDESRSWFKFNFCSQFCYDGFKAKIN